jgi:hypothetical protein
MVKMDKRGIGFLCFTITKDLVKRLFIDHQHFIRQVKRHKFYQPLQKIDTDSTIGTQYRAGGKQRIRGKRH